MNGKHGWDGVGRWELRSKEYALQDLENRAGSEMINGERRELGSRILMCDVVYKIPVLPSKKEPVVHFDVP
jgi:hypothetical protein